MVSKKHFCNVPWFHTQIEHDGTFLFCCTQIRTLSAYKKGSKRSNYNIQNMSISEWFHSDLMTEFRQRMLSGAPLHECSVCYRDESFDNESYRIMQNWRSVIFTKDAFEQSFEQSPHYDYFTQPLNLNAMPVDLHVNMGNECNLACKFCHPSASSKIASKYKVWNLLDASDAVQMNWMDDDATWLRFCNELLTIKNLRAVHFMGGEPMINPRLEEFVDFFIANNKTDFQISFVTNGTKYNANLIQKMKKFAPSFIDISIESILDNNYYIRQDLDKELFLRNLKSFLSEQTETFSICLKPTISLLSIPTLPELMLFFLENNISTENNVCYDPAYLQVPVLPMSVREHYFEKYEHALKTIKAAADQTPTSFIQPRNREQNASNLYSELYSIYQMVKAPEPANAHELRQQLVYWLTKWDLDKHHDIRDFYPEWNKFLQEYGYKNI